MRLSRRFLHSSANFRDLRRHNHFENAATGLLGVEENFAELARKVNVVRMIDSNPIAAGQGQFDREDLRIGEQGVYVVSHRRDGQTSSSALGGTAFSADRFDLNNLAGINGQRKVLSFIRENNQIPGAGMECGVIRMLDYMPVAARKCDFYGKIFRRPQEPFDGSHGLTLCQAAFASSTASPQFMGGPLCDVSASP
jgi:hypothetical protein